MRVRVLILFLFFARESAFGGIINLKGVKALMHDHNSKENPLTFGIVIGFINIRSLVINFGNIHIPKLIQIVLERHKENPILLISLSNTKLFYHILGHIVPS